ncbi:threonine/homoserine/homoserine lactone efflux protein [Serratia fonticola]|jgi:threonine/homoserine/homoserine lactone efflux protein|uniref:Threonine/homoserine/homoserine lactone efflux protein n=1 Tax=Serratia fonticola TaxID=47917 RepID=A0A542BNE4_SERFO|nr:LysE family translocator [Serratia fonticola]TQI80111.1 threonine/homoserine/homoserine lactone efflux protein [Serratia fonticola]TQI97862.1 threonine/homoserine/homoserine lactone efflux protein [Serratia fonticola]TVZ72360.1 threonine/homoserine/homoserine lactone efflux protein [Serratia fonticola]
MMELVAVAIITILAVISPGADFAMVTRNSYLFGRRAGLFAAVGIALGVQVHVTYTIMGVGFIIAHSPPLFSAIKIVGAAYLIYIGYKTFFTQVRLNIDLSSTVGLSPLGALRMGFFTNALNPKTTLFVVSTYTQVVNPETSVLLQIAYGLFMSFAHWIWFSLVALFFSHAALRDIMLAKQEILNKTIGGILMGLGISLAFSPMMS